MRHQFFLITVWFFLLSALPAFSQTPTRGPAPSWAVQHPISDSALIDPASLLGGYHVLLKDIQRNIPLEQSYLHFAIRITNGDGVQNMSDIDINFDPTYQTLQFHMLRLHRDGEIINNLNNHEIKTFQRESGMERHLYDGSLTAVINQENVRIGDIIEYAFTVSGFNPIHGDSFFNDFFQQATVPIQNLHIKIISEKDYPIHFQYRNDAVEALIQYNDSSVEYSWDFSDLQAYLYPDNTPAWYNPLPEVQISSYSQWSQMVEWAWPHYQINTEDRKALKALAPQLTPAENLDDQILQAIRFVQDEVRYLGLEGGLGAYRPNQPLLVYERRFGDCKDKSLLLVALLRNLGLKAHPVLVNTELESHLSDEIPSPWAFNHCIVTFQHDGRDVFIDPTISNQGGDLDHLDVLTYGKGLVIASETTSLENLPVPEPDTILVEYLFEMEEIGKSATLNVNTTYGGLRADYQRDRVQADGIQSMGKSSLDYYSNAYPGIFQLHPLEVIDESRNSNNQLIIKEQYQIEGFWTVDVADSNALSSEITPLEMLDVADVLASAQRTAPYATGGLLDFQLNITLMMPEDWPVKPGEFHIHDEVFKYDSTLENHGPQVEATFRYQRLQEFISAEDTKAYIANHNRIWDDLFLYISYQKDSQYFTFSWFMGALACMILVLALVVARNIHRNFDLVVTSSDKGALPISGWLIIPALGVIFRPFMELIILISNTHYYNHNTWIEVLESSQYSSFSSLGFVMVYEVLVNIVFLVFSLLVLWQFFKKRSSLPRLMIVLLAGSVVLTALNIGFGYFLLEDPNSTQTNPTQWGLLLVALISALIWIPYFLTSSRVKQTFVHGAQGHAAPSPMPVLRQDARWPAAIVITALVHLLSILVLLSLFIFGNLYELPSDALPGTPQATGYLGGFLLTMFLILACPSVGLISILSRRTWARKFNLVLFILGALTIPVFALFMYLIDPEPDAIDGLLGFGVILIPVAITALLLMLNKEAKSFPVEGPGEPAVGTTQFDFKILCRQQASELFQEIQESAPHLSMTIQDSTPDIPVSLVIPEQPGVARTVYMDLKKTNVLNLSLGPALMLWNRCHFEGVRHEFRDTVVGILNGAYQYREYVKGDQVQVARIQRPEGNQWVEVRKWNKNRFKANFNLVEVVLDFGATEDSAPDRD